MATILESDFLEWQRYAAAFIEKEEADVLVLSGGYGSGKTALNCHIIREMVEKRASRGLVIATTHPTIKDTVAASLDDEIPELYNLKLNRQPPFVWQFDCFGQTTELISRTMRYAHESKPRLKSINADFLWLVEGTELPKEAYIDGVSRLRRLGADAYYPVLVETNPSSKTHWVYQSFMEGAKEIFTDPEGNWKILKKTLPYVFEGITKDLRVITFMTTTYANPHIPPQIIAQMKAGMSPTEQQRLIHGEWNAIEGRVWETYHTFTITQELPAYAAKYDRVFIGCDPGQRDPTGIVFIGYSRGVYEIFDSFLKPEKSVAEVMRMIDERIDLWGVRDRIRDIWIDPFGIGAQWRREWMDKDHPTILARSGFAKGSEPTLQMAMKLGEMLRLKRLLINSECRDVITDIENAIWKTGQLKEKIDKEVWNPHLMEAAGTALGREAA